MENVSTMLDSILNALGWPWSRKNQPSSSSTLQINHHLTEEATTTLASTLLTSDSENVVTTNTVSKFTPQLPFDAYFLPFPTFYNPFNETNIPNVIHNITETFTISTPNTTLNYFPNDSTQINSENLDYYNTWWNNCNTTFNCQYYSQFDLGENATSINHSHSTNSTISNDYDTFDESTIYLIQIIVTAIILGIVILATVIGKWIFN